MNNSLNLLLDGNNIIFRAYYVVKNKRKIISEVDTTTVEQFFKIIKSYVNTFEPNNIYVAWDKKINENGINFRKELIDYKGNRNLDEETVSQIFSVIDTVIDLCEAIGIKNMFPWNLEADDVLSYLRDNLEGNNIIVSSDKDLYQLINESTTIYNTTKNEEVNEDNFEEFVGVAKDIFVDYKCLLGDKSDNIDGVPSYGEVRSKKLAVTQDWDILTEEQLEILNRNRKIINLEKSYLNSDGELQSYTEQLKDLDIMTKFDSHKFKEICDFYNLTSLKRDTIFWKDALSTKNIMASWFTDL